AVRMGGSADPFPTNAMTLRTRTSGVIFRVTFHGHPVFPINNGNAATTAAYFDRRVMVQILSTALGQGAISPDSAIARSEGSNSCEISFQSVGDIIVPWGRRTIRRRAPDRDRPGFR